jgi:hypothetical protein
MADNCCSSGAGGDAGACSCGCDSNRENKLCELAKPHNRFDVEKVMALVNKPQYFCRCCGRLANQAENLCHPIPLIKRFKNH